MAYRSAAHRPPERVHRITVCAHVATTAAVQPAWAVQRWRDDDRLPGQHNDGRHLLVHDRVDQRRCRLRDREADRVYEISGEKGGRVQCDVEPDRAALGRSQLRRRRGRPVHAGPVAELVSGQGEQRLVAGVDGHRRQRHLLIERVGQL